MNEMKNFKNEQIIENELEEIIENIIEDARNGWCSHQEENDGIENYILKIKELILNNLV